MPSLGVVANVYQECHAIHGWLEAASRMFDEVVCYHTGPGGKPSTDGTIEIVEKWGARLEWGDIHEGFGVVRAKAVALSTCEWVAILDADERMYPVLPLLECEGTEGYPQVAEPHLVVRDTGQTFNQRAYLRERISDPNVDAICAIRRHHFDFSGRRPCQNWQLIPDLQLRILRNNGHIGYDAGTRMHERCVDFRTGQGPRMAPAHPQFGPYFDHYHLAIKRMEPEQRAEDIETFDRIHAGSVPPGDVNQQ